VDEAAVARLRASIRSGGVAVLAVDLKSGRAAGAGTFSPPIDGVTELTGVAVAPAFRRRGIAAALTDALATEAAAAGVSTIFLIPANDDVERIYARIGFRTVSEILHISVPPNEP
jgi:ribosomal protein S18 acetylase RimI-like enzyme